MFRSVLDIVLGKIELIGTEEREIEELYEDSNEPITKEKLQRVVCEVVGKTSWIRAKKLEVIIGQMSLPTLNAERLLKKISVIYDILPDECIQETMCDRIDYVLNGISELNAQELVSGQTRPCKLDITPEALRDVFVAAVSDMALDSLKTRYPGCTHNIKGWEKESADNIMCYFRDYVEPQNINLLAENFRILASEVCRQVEDELKECIDMVVENALNLSFSQA